MTARDRSPSPEGPDGSAGSPVQWRPTGRQLLQGVVGLALAVALVVWGLPHFAKTSWDEVFQVLHHVGWGAAGGMLALMLGGLWLYTFTLTGSLPGLSHGKALIVNVCGSSVGNLLPGGGAAGVAATYALCRSWGFGRRDISTSVIVSGVWNILARVALPVVGVGALLFGAGGLPKAVVRGGVAGAVVAVLLMALFVSVLVSERAATVVGRTLDRVLRPLWRRSWAGRELTIDELVRDLRARITDVVRHGWISMTFGLVGLFGVYYVLFWFCLHAVGVAHELRADLRGVRRGAAPDRRGRDPRRRGRDRVRDGGGARGLGSPAGRRARRGRAVLGLHAPDGDPARRARLAGLGPLAQAATAQPTPEHTRGPLRRHRATRPALTGPARRGALTARNAGTTGPERRARTRTVRRSAGEPADLAQPRLVGDGVVDLRGLELAAGGTSYGQRDQGVGEGGVGRAGSARAGRSRTPSR